MTSLAASVIQFGSYVFPLGAKIKSRDVSGDIEETKMLGFDGTIAPPGLLGAQIVTVTVEMGAGGDFDPATSTPTDINYLVTMDNLNDAINEMLALLQEGYQALTIGYSPARTIQAQKRKFTVAYDDGFGRRRATIDMEFYCPDPRWLASTVQTETTSGASITNNGNMNTYPVVTYMQTGGSASQTVMLRIGIGTGLYVELDLALTMNSGDVLVIDCDPRNRANGIIYTPSGGQPVNGLALLGTSGIVNTIGNDWTFPVLIPGSHVITFQGANSISAAWSDAYAQ